MCLFVIQGKVQDLVHKVIEDMFYNLESLFFWFFKFFNDNFFVTGFQRHFSCARISILFERELLEADLKTCDWFRWRHFGLGWQLAFYGK